MSYSYRAFQFQGVPILTPKLTVCHAGHVLTLLFQALQTNCKEHFDSLGQDAGDDMNLPEPKKSEIQC